MSFSGDIRAELLRAPMEAPCCIRAELKAMVVCAGSLSFRGPGRFVLSVGSEHSAVVRYIFTQTARHTHIEPMLQSVRSARLERVTYQLVFDEAQSADFLAQMALLDASAPFGAGLKLPASALRRNCCRRAFLRGAYLVSGYINAPEKRYHFEFALPDGSRAEVLMRVMRRLGTPARAVERKNQTVVYIKDSERIATLLRLIGAHNALLAFENVRILKGVRNSVNRQVNCDAYNVESALSAAQRQIEDIRAIAAHGGGLLSLPAPLRDIAELRLDNADASLSELGAMLKPPLGKSGVNNRLRRLGAIAERIRAERGDD